MSEQERGLAWEIEHSPTPPWVEIVARDVVRLRVAAGPGVEQITVEVADRYSGDDPQSIREWQMLRVGGGARVVWSAAVHAPTRRLRYRFRLLSDGGSVVVVGPRSGSGEDWFHVPYLYPAPEIEEWLGWCGRTVYALMPGYVGPGTGSAASVGSEVHGQLRRIVDGLDSLRALGVGVLYLNPIFVSGSEHGYDVENYVAVDRRLGD